MLRRVFGSTKSPMDADDVVAAARCHFAHDFANRSRAECPNQQALSDLIRRGELPSNELRTHLFACSECFQHYRDELGRRSASPAIASQSQSLSQFSAWRSAFALVGVVLLFLGVVIIGLWVASRSRQSSSPNLSAQAPAVTSPPVAIHTEPQPNSTLDENAPINSSHPGALRQPRTSASPDLVAANKVSIDLERYNTLRNGNPAQITPITLKAASNQLTIRLISGSPRGPYTVSLNDPFGTLIRSSKASSNDGVVLRANLILDSIKPGRYLICITRKEEVPDCMSAIINDK